MSLPDLRALAPRPAQAPRTPLVDARGIYEHEGTPVAYVRPLRPRGWMMAEVGGRERFYPKRKGARKAACRVVEEHAYRARQPERRREHRAAMRRSRRVDRRREWRNFFEAAPWVLAWAVIVIVALVILMAPADPDADPSGCDSPGVAMQSPYC